MKERTAWQRSELLFSTKNSQLSNLPCCPRLQQLKTRRVRAERHELTSHGLVHSRLRKQLRQFLAGTGVSPLVRPKSD